ncbi:claudin-4 [Oryzias melastigma]|uniref:claudin-4 n=1 Tax=Oryzias melastigma TaxID=30732 RepID=UPI000CF7CB43|nr:claudin-4 [Oryzias melastigma]
MFSMLLQILGFVLGIISFFGTIFVCTHHVWKMTTLIGENILITWGFWERCVTWSTGQIDCMYYDSLVVLPQDLRIARMAMVIAIIAALLGAILVVSWGEFINFIYEESSRDILVIAAGIAFICAGVLVHIALYWSAIAIIKDFYSIGSSILKAELGDVLYIGWVPGRFLIMGGALLILVKIPLLLRKGPLILDKADFILGRTLLILGRVLLILSRALNIVGKRLLIIGVFLKQH